MITLEQLKAAIGDKGYLIAHDSELHSSPCWTLALDNRNRPVLAHSGAGVCCRYDRQKALGHAIADVEKERAVSMQCPVCRGYGCDACVQTGYSFALLKAFHAAISLKMRERCNSIVDAWLVREGFDAFCRMASGRESS